MAQNGQSRRSLAIATGFGIGVIWIAMALYVIVKAIAGYNHDRPDYGFIWSLVGVLLCAAGGASLIGTWWHLIRTPRHDH